MLDAERNTYYSYAEEQAEKGMHEGYLPPSAKHPDYVSDQRKASWLARSEGHVLSEREKSIGTYLHQLPSERNADDGDAEKESCENIEE
mgnify:CR=1 FL=1